MRGMVAVPPMPGVPVPGVPVPPFVPDLHQVHPAFRAFTGLGAGHLGMHRAGIDRLRSRRLMGAGGMGGVRTMAAVAAVGRMIAMAPMPVPPFVPGFHQVHAAFGAVARFIAHHLGMHRAGIGRFCRRFGVCRMLAMRGMVAVPPMPGVPVPPFVPGLHQVHPAFRAFTGLVTHHLGVHRAGIRPVRCRIGGAMGNGIGMTGCRRHAG